MTMPDVSDALWDFGSEVQFKVVQSSVVDHLVVDSPIVTVGFQAVVEPIPPTKLMIKPEGERRWKWFNLWTTQDLDLDSIIKDENDFTYRVMSKSDWNRSGYFEYELTQGIDA